MKRFVLFIVAASVYLFSPVARGQILFVASLDSSQETPPTRSQGQGTAWAVLGADLTTLTYSVTYAHLDTTFTAGHFHVGAPGVAGPVAFLLTFSGNTSTGTWLSVPDSIVRALLQGRLYVNIHSLLNPAGEIRGQFRMVSAPGFSMSLSPLQETPPTGTGSTGTGWAWLDSTGHVQYRVTIAGLSDSLTGAHFHLGAAGVAGPVVHPVSFTDSTSQDSAVMFADSLLVAMLKGRIYFNVHSKSHPGGEIRGQLIQANGIRFTASIDGSQEAPPNSSKGQATLWATLSEDLSSLSYRATYAHLDSTFTAAHLHISPAGAVVHPISFSGNTSDGSWDNIPDSLLLALVKGNIYMNIHSIAHPAGEIRGFVKVAQGVEFTISMDAGEETPPTGTSAEGTGWAVLDSSGVMLSYRATIAGLSSSLTAAHFHDAPPGVSGAVVDPVAFTDSTTQGEWTGFPDNILTDLLKGDIYLNVHSTSHPGGEIRGNLMYGSLQATGIEPVSGDAVPRTYKLEQNFPNPFNPSTEIQFQLDRTAHVSLIVYNILGQKVSTLVNQEEQAGVYRVMFDASGLSSGVYFYRLATDDGLVATKDMILVK
jgi:hypothetical protein